MRKNIVLVFLVFLLLGLFFMSLEISAEEHMDFKLGAVHSSSVDDVIWLGTIRHSSRMFTLGDINDITRARYRFILDDKSDYFIHNLDMSIYNKIDNSEQDIIGLGLSFLLMRDYVIEDFSADMEGLGLSLTFGLREDIFDNSELYLAAEVIPGGIYRIPSLERGDNFVGYGIDFGFDYKLREALKICVGGLWQRYNFAEEELSDMTERLGGIYAGVILVW